MPIQQLENQQGGLGTVLGLVGGYLAGNPARKAAQADREQKKAQQDIENKRNANTDAATAARDKDTHDNITSEIATRNANSASATADKTNTQFQQGAYAKLSGMLHSPPPAGTTAQQWVAHIQQQVPTLGLTDPNLLGKLYGEAQGVLTEDQTKQNATFAGGEMALPSDPAKKLSVLMKRLQVEKGKPGFDLKPTESMITDTQKQITEAQAAAHQAQTDAETKRHHVVQENRPRTTRVTVDNGSQPSPAENAVYTRAAAAKTPQEAYRIVDDPKNGLNYKQRTAMREAIRDQHPDKPVDKVVDPLVQRVTNFIASKPLNDRLNTLITSDTFKNAKPDQQNAMLQAVKNLP